MDPSIAARDADDVQQAATANQVAVKDAPRTDRHDCVTGAQVRFGDRSRQQATEGDLAGEVRPVIAEQLPARDRAQPVRADQDIRLVTAAVGKLCDHARVLLDVRQPAAEHERLRVERAHRRQEQGLQIGAVDVTGHAQTGIRVIRLGLRTRRQYRTGLKVRKGKACNRQRSAEQRRCQSQGRQSRGGTGAERDAGTDLLEALRLFVDAHTPAAQQQRECGREAADARTDDRRGALAHIGISPRADRHRPRAARR